MKPCFCFFKKLLLLFVVVSLLLTCNRSNRWLEQWRTKTDLPGHLTIHFPFDGSLFPPEIAPTTVRWSEKTDAQQWLVVVSKPNKDVLFSTICKDTLWQPDSLLWHKMKNIGLTEPVKISVLGVNGRQITSGASCTIHTSTDSVGAPIFYRAVPLPFLFAVKNFDKIRWHLGDVASAKPAATLLQNLPLCGNCHTFSRDGRTLAMDVDYANDKGSYVISAIDEKTVLTPDKIITWSSYRPQDDQQTFGLLSHISPDGRYVASTVKDRSIFVATEGLYYSQLFFPIKGIIAIYDRHTNEFFSLPGADDPRYVQSNPTWSPDGQYLYFCHETAYTSPAIEKTSDVLLPTELAQEFIDGKREFKFDIYRIPFQNGRGGIAEPVRGASNNGRSNFFPRLSPNGKWLVFCQAENFMLLQPDSKLYILPPEGGEPRLLSCNTEQMNSWHSWSPNSRWLVYASKIRSAYTDLLLTHIDDNGRSSPPILLENLSFQNYASNIPEFVNLQNRTWSALVDEFSQQAHYYFTKARSYAGKQQIDLALQALDTAISLEPTYAKSYILKGHIEFANGLFDRALVSYEKATLYEKNDAELYLNLGTTCYKLEKFEKALEAFHYSDELRPTQFDVYLGRALVYAKMDRLHDALREYDRALDINPQSGRVYYERGICHALLNDWKNAAMDLQQAVHFEPTNVNAHEKLGSSYYQLHEYQKAVDSYTTAISLEPKYKLYEYRGDSRFKLYDLQGALDDYSMSIDIQPRAGTSFYRRGVIYLRLGDAQAGCRDLLTAKQLGLNEADELLRKHCQ